MDLWRYFREAIKSRKCWKGFRVKFGQRALNFNTAKKDKYFFAINTEKYNWFQNPFLANAKMSTKELFLPI